MGKCKKCGKENAKDSKVCAECGDNLEEQAKPTQNEATEARLEPAGTKKRLPAAIAISITAVLILLACCAISGIGVWQYISRANDAKKVADTAIAKAKKSLGEAELATELGTKEEPEYKKAKTSYKKAVSLRNEASLVNIARYNQAAASANKSYKESQVINKRVLDAYQAAIKLPDDAPDKLFDALFDVYMTYPRSKEGKHALSYAETRLNLIIDKQLALDKVKTISIFAGMYPEKDLPEQVIDKAKHAIINISGEDIPTLKQIHSDNQTWVNTMNSGGQTTGDVESNFRFQSSIASSISVYETLIGVMPSLSQDAEIQRLVSVVYEACKCANQCDSIAKAPVSVDGNTNYYSPEQLDQVSASAASLATYINEAETLYNKKSTEA